MSGIEHEPTPLADSDATDLWLAQRFQNLRDHARKNLDIEAGLDEILLAHRHAVLREATAERLDIDSGLREIVPERRPSVAPSTTAAFAHAESLSPEFRTSLANLANLSPLDRLRLNATVGPGLRQASRLGLRLLSALGLILVRGLFDVHSIHGIKGIQGVQGIHEADHDSDGRLRRVAIPTLVVDLERAATVSRNLDLDLARHFARASTLGGELVIVLELNQQTELAHILARRVAEHLALGLGSYGRPARLVNVRAVSGSLGSDLSRSLESLGRVSHHFACAPVIARDMARDRGRPLTSHLTQNLVPFLVAALGALSDVRGADLRGVDLADVPLEGARWSNETLWPDEWRDQIVQHSVEVPGEPGVYVIESGTAFADV